MANILRDRLRKRGKSMELEYMIYVTLEDGSKEEILMWADEDCDINELMALAHDKVMTKFGGYSKITRVELN